MEKIFQILVSYLRESNFNSDGSSTDDDTYYKIIDIPAKSSDEAMEKVESFIFESEDWCGIEKDYVSDTLEIERMLSTVGHDFLYLERFRKYNKIIDTLMSITKYHNYEDTLEDAGDLDIAINNMKRRIKQGIEYIQNNKSEFSNNELEIFEEQLKLMNEL